MTAVQRRSYDHRLRLAIATSGDTGLFRDVDIPPSTRRSWTTRAVPNVVALHEQDRDLVELQVALARVEAVNAKLRAVIKLLLALLAVRGGRIAGHLVPAASDKARLLAAVRRSDPVLGKSAALRVLGLTPERACEWNRRALECRLEDAPSCPKQTPQQLTTGPSSDTPPTACGSTTPPSAPPTLGRRGTGGYRLKRKRPASAN